MIDIWFHLKPKNKTLLPVEIFVGRYYSWSGTIKLWCPLGSTGRETLCALVLRLWISLTSVVSFQHPTLPCSTTDLKYSCNKIIRNGLSSPTHCVIFPTLCRDFFYDTEIPLSFCHKVSHKGKSLRGWHILVSKFVTLKPERYSKLIFSPI